MKALFLVAVILVITGGVWAQGGGDSPDCSDFISGQDTGCSSIECNNDLTGCSAQAFTASCTATYAFDVWVKCPDGADCGGCEVCAYVYENGQLIQGGSCHNNGCDTGDCNNTCSVNLVSGHSYRLYVCLVKCHDEPNCDHCNGNCVAYACLRYGQIVPCGQ